MREKKKKLTQKKIKKQMINKLENKKVIKQGMISKKQSKLKELNDLIKKHIFYRI